MLGMRATEKVFASIGIDAPVNEYLTEQAVNKISITGVNNIVL